MTQMTLSAILLVIGALAYLTSGILIVRALRRPEGRAPAGLRTLALAGFVLHCAGVATEMFFGDLIHFGFGMAVSAMLLIAVAITLTESYVHRLNALTGTVLIIAAARKRAAGGLSRHDLSDRGLVDALSRASLGGPCGLQLHDDCGCSGDFPHAHGSCLEEPPQGA